MRTGFRWGNKGKGRSEIIGVDARKMLKMDLQKVGWDVEWIYLAQIRKSVRSGDCGNELSGFVNCWKFLG